MYIPSNAIIISFAIVELIISAASRKMIVPTSPINEAAMPATTFTVLLFGIGYAGSLDDA